MAESVVILTPDVGGEQIVQRGDGLPPGDAARYLQPFGVLIEHGIDDVNEGLVAGEEPVPSGEQVAFEPPLAQVLAQYFHDAAVGRDMIVVGENGGGGSSIGDLEERAEAVRGGFIRSEHAEVVGAAVFLHAGLHPIAQHVPEHAGGFAKGGAGLRNAHGVVVKVREPQGLEQESAVSMWIHAHAPRSLRHQGRDFGPGGTQVVKEFLGPVALHPIFEDLDVGWLLGQLLQWNLMRTEGAFNQDAIDNFGAGPALRRNQNDDGPGGTLAESVFTRVLLNGADFKNNGFESGGHGLMHGLRLMALDVVGAVAATGE